MLRFFYLLLLGFVIVLFFTSCLDSENSDFEETENSPRIYFQYDFYCGNGGSRYGYYIDSAGRIYCYNEPELIPLNETDSINIITLEVMNSRLAETTVLNYAIEMEELKRVAESIPRTEKGKISFERGECCDFPIISFYSYISNPFLSNYTQINLGKKGDINQTNHSPEAQELITWLEIVFKDLVKLEYCW